MISAGNDIVAFNKVNKHNTNQFAYYSKILSNSEQKLYSLPQCSWLPFDQYVWLLWSVKESAYKFLKRINPELIFSPTKTIVGPIETYGDDLVMPANQKLLKGKVHYGTSVLFFMSRINEEWIASVVNDEESFENICWEVVRIEEDSYSYQSNAAKELLLKKLGHFLPGNLTVEKNVVGYPEIVKNNQKVNLPASIAHHGFFISYAFNMTNFR